MWQQIEFQLPAMRRGFHLITEQVEIALSKMSPVSIGLLHIQLLHTSASLTINENADPSVRRDMERHFSHMVPENQPYYEHIYEGSDDMPAHIKASMLGSSLMISIRDKRLCLGIWQGIYLGEHRDHGGVRRIVLTLQGE
ncbi:YjbQ family protein [Marinomonas rhizomae]|uniref:Secondary thiamine-phosphate synthase enzyme n=1 Tax=Marinomonas rhizomae TaxID=491948 RepID=A0A366J1Z7_9GAMM|nr:secondary thiamine-phosphate synthase enzyme YjbQ [Marinomonas rhizomae]RBP79968.1 secondary thiamine-phosphate synthase enzyme [Marinomonas rhizomae]RNF71899.1 YjbQ family protein [Marinomonas rhizomae]